MKWEEHFTYNNGDLYWLPQKGRHIFNAKYAGKKAGHDTSSGYKAIRINNKVTRCHRIIWEMFNGPLPKGMEVDHINEIKNDNRIENLQLVTHIQNVLRSVKSKGFSWVKAKQLFISQKVFDNKNYFLGYFGTPCGAYMANRMFFVK